MTDETTNATKTFRFTVTPEHRASLLAPFPINPGDRDSQSRHIIRIPALDDYPGCRTRDKGDGLGPMVAAVTREPPVILVGDATSTFHDTLDRSYWHHLIETAKYWRYPINKLLIGREITLAVRMIKMTNAYVKDQDIPWIVAVRIEGDLDSFSKDEGLEEHIKHIKRMLDYE